MNYTALLKELYGAYCSNFKGDKWPRLALVAVIYERKPQLVETEATELVAENAQRNGWVRYRSALWSREDKDKAARWTGDEKEPGPPLAAEWVSDDRSSSVHLRADPEKPGCFVKWTYAERDCANGEIQPNEILALRQEVIVLAHPVADNPRVSSPTPVLIYHVYWGADQDDPSAIRRLFSRFAGFGSRCDRVVSLKSERISETST